MATHITVGIYGTVKNDPPYIGSNSNNAFGAFEVFTDPTGAITPVQMSVPTTGTVFHQVQPGQQVGNTGQYIYSVIEVTASGLNVHGDKYACNSSVATLATAAG